MIAAVGTNANALVFLVIGIELYEAGAAKVAIQITTGMASHHGDSQTGNEPRQRAMATLFDGCQQTLEGLFTKARGLQKLVPILFQLIQIAEVTDPTVTKELGQGGLGQSLNVHPGLLTEVGKLPDKLDGIISSVI